MKTTMLMRPIANPRRTTLVNVTDAGPQAAGPQTATAATPATDRPQAEQGSLPQQTANPRRTVLTELPATPAATVPATPATVPATAAAGPAV